MKSKIIGVLAALNGVLLLGLFVPHGFNRPAAAQVNARPSEYLQIPGEALGNSSAIVYLIDEQNRQLSAMAVDQNGKLQFMPARQLDRDFGALP